MVAVSVLSVWGAIYAIIALVKLDLLWVATAVSEEGGRAVIIFAALAGVICGGLLGLLYCEWRDLW